MGTVIDRRTSPHAEPLSPAASESDDGPDGSCGTMRTTHNARVQLFATASSNLGVAATAAGVVAPMVSGEIRFLPSLVAWTVIGIDFIALAWVWLGRLRG